MYGGFVYQSAMVKVVKINLFIILHILAMVPLEITAFNSV